jgi:tetratricopeptide (TPR) repeat protein
MKNITRKVMQKLLAIFLAAACATPAQAAYEDVGVGARVQGMGNAFTAIADDVYSIYYNPAGLGTLERPQLATTYSRLFTGLSDNSNLQNSFLAYERPLQYGRQGTLGLAWNYFTLDSLYKEMSLYTSYGRRIFAEQAPNGLYAGATLKYLNRSIGGVSAAGNSFNNTGLRTGLPDPVLQKGSKSNIDMDFGLLYRIRPKLSLGVMFQHLFEPNIAFSDSDTDKLGRNVKLAAAYQTPWTAFTGELGFIKAPDGSTDKVLTLATEKWLPTLLYGTFGLRGSLGVGSRSYRQVTTGMSYKVHRMRVDYGFSIPLGTVSSTFGNHRIGMSFEFGRPRGAEPKFSEAILENLRDLASVGTPEFRAQAEELALYKRTAQREFLRQARVDTGEGRFDEARSKLFQALSLNPKDKGIRESLERMKLVAESYPVLEGFRTDPAEAALYEGIMEFIAGRDRKVLPKVAYAQSLKPADERLEAFVQVVERTLGITRDLTVVPTKPIAAPTMGKEKVIGASMALAEVALREQKWDTVLVHAREILEIDPTHARAHKWIATVRYAKKDYVGALKSLRTAYKFEGQSESRKRIKGYIDAMASLIERQKKGGLLGKPKTPKKGPRKMSPYEIQRAYEAGVDLYAQGRLTEALTTFERILKSDPKNASARRAAARIKSEILRGQQ